MESHSFGGVEEGRGWVDRAMVDVDDEWSFGSSEGTKSCEELGNIGFV